MPQLQLKRIQTLLVKIEATEGTDAVPAGGDAVQLIEPATIGFGAEMINDQPDLQNQSLDEEGPAPPGAKFVTIDFKLWLRGFGSAYSAGNKPEIDALLQALGFSSTGSFGGGTEKYDYDSLSASMKTVTCYAFQGLETGVYVKHVLLAGRIDKAQFRFVAGKPVEFSGTIKGLYVSPADASTIAPTYQSQVCPNWGAGNGFTLGSFSTGVTREATLSIDNNLAPRLSGNGPTDSIAGYVQGRRIITFDARFEAMRIADVDAFTTWLNATAQTLQFKMPGGTGTQYKRMTILCDKAKIREAPTYQDERDLWLQRISGKVSPLTATNRCKITFD